MLQVFRWWQQLKICYHFLQAHAWRLVCGRPERGLAMYGVTGTNGKTTTCYLLDGILTAEFGREHVGMLTTVALRIGGREEMNETKLTTLPSRVVYQKLRMMAEAGVTQVVMEMTSHALVQRRLAGLRLDGAIILNIEREHLDYHGSMAAYAWAKGRIVGYLKPGAPLVVKGDDAWVMRTVSGERPMPHDPITFTAAQAQSVATLLPGQWNKENVLAASLLAEAVGVPRGAIARGVAAVRAVPGRMEWVERVLIDYAVTPGALARLYQEVRALLAREGRGGRIFAVLGAAGLRDRGKRPAMARAVAEIADELVLTREDPWAEDEEQIFRDLERGLVPLGSPSPASAGDGQPPTGGLTLTGWRRIADRREAIAWCLQRAGPDDVVVVTGKGAERGMAVEKKIIPWSDREVILEIMSELPVRLSPDQVLPSRDGTPPGAAAQ